MANNIKFKKKLNLDFLIKIASFFGEIRCFFTKNDDLFFLKKIENMRYTRILRKTFCFITFFSDFYTFSNCLNFEQN